MSENKCPCCGEELKFGDKISGFYPTVDCKKCGFPRNPHMRKRIAAALDLAKAVVKHDTEMKNNDDMNGDYAEIASRHVSDMEKRVLEVFNG